MATFQVLSRTAQLAVPPKKRPRRLSQEWASIIRFVVAVSGASGLFVLVTIFKGSNDTVFILLPVFVYLAATQFQRYNLHLPMFVFNMFLNSTPVYLFLTVCLAFVYYGFITVVELLIHQSPDVSHIILITTALTWAIILDPVRVYVQKRIERRFNVRNREAIKAVEAFTSTLREEIDLDQLLERYLTVIQQIMQPYSVSLWILAFNKQQEQSNSTEEITVAGNDPLIAYMLSHPGAAEIDRLQLDAPLLQNMKARGAQYARCPRPTGRTGAARGTDGARATGAGARTRTYRAGIADGSGYPARLFAQRRACAPRVAACPLLPACTRGRWGLLRFPPV